IPTAGEVPIIQAMLSLGMGVGPAAALLMTLPPISVPSLAMLARSFKPYMLAIVAGLVVVFGIASGLLAIAFGF
ncbi:MAG TPA: permease, partial [Burkholderia sp.]|nr:permease [Burkholderia sp.]